MFFTFPEIKVLKRCTNFPLNVSRLYLCSRQSFPVEEVVVYDRYEVTLRLEADEAVCSDEINGEVINMPFPHVIFKEPGMVIKINSPSPREAVGFSFSAEGMALLRSWGMLPPKFFMPVTMTKRLEHFLRDFRKFTFNYPSMSAPGDRIDGICFGILQEILLEHLDSPIRERTPEMRIREAELFLRHHFNEPLNLDEVAARFGFSHSAFYQCWKKYYTVSPHAFIEELKLRSAALELLQTAWTVAEVAKDVQYPGITAFHRKFKERFGATPNEFRKNPEIWQKEFPELLPH